MIPIGLWDEEIELSFSSKSNGGSKVFESGDERVEVGRLDDMAHGRIRFVKMDIEGSEYRALGGGKSIIPEYKLYLRHYSIAAETVLYAI